METPKQWRAAIRAGMAFLNVMRPGWRKKIDLGRLNLEDPKCCVLGEVYGDYFEGRDELLNGDDMDDDAMNNRAESLGFYANNEDHYPQLTKLWREEYRKAYRAAKEGR